VVAVSAPVETLPLVALVPLQPPDAVHEVALVVLQVSVEVPPLAILARLALKVTVGDGGGGVTVTVAVATAVVPLAPEQVSV
jgi:hypothetical protein